MKNSPQKDQFSSSIYHIRRAMSLPKHRKYLLSNSLVLRMVRGGKKALLKPREILMGVGALFLGKKSGRDVAYLAHDYNDQIAEFGGRCEHENGVETMMAEVYEESATTLKIELGKKGQLILNKKIRLKGFVLDTFYEKNKVYRVFIFNVGKRYSEKNGFSKRLFLAQRRKLEQKENTHKSFLETTNVYHVSLKKLLQIPKYIVVNKTQKEKLRRRTLRLFYLLKKINQ